MMASDVLKMFNRFLMTVKVRSLENEILSNSLITSYYSGERLLLAFQAKNSTMTARLRQLAATLCPVNF